MKLQDLMKLLALSCLINQGYGQGIPEDSGLVPLTSTFYLNNPDAINNSSTESIGIAILNDGNILVGWEDDNGGLMDLQAVWTLIDKQGQPLTAEREISSLATPDEGTIQTRFLSFFRADGSPTPANTAWGPKIKANRFGQGMGLGATAFSLGAEIAELAGINQDSTEESGVGDFPAVQILNNDGSPKMIVTGASDSDAQPSGDIRIADWDFLSNGNIVVAGESRQEQAFVDIFGGTTPNRHVVYRVLDSNGNEIKPLSLVSQALDVRTEMWHGIGVTQNGFAIRYSKGGRATVRHFSNDGTPLTDDIDIAELTENEFLVGGGRGDSAGFMGNGRDAYVLVDRGSSDSGLTQAYVTVLNSDGSLRYSRLVNDDFPEVAVDRVAGAIDPVGRVIAVFDSGHEAGFRLPMARVFDESGEPVAESFYISETENFEKAFSESRRVRIDWRGDLVGMVWESLNSPETSNKVIAVRLFSIASKLVNPLTPITNSIYINIPDAINNNSTESIGVSIASNSNVIIGWEDDGDDLNDLEAVWTLWDTNGNLLTESAEISSLAAPDATPIQARFRSFFRMDGSPIPGNTSWGPKIKANWFGDGMGMGATAFAIGGEIEELLNINQDSTPESGVGDFPAVQILGNDGLPKFIATGAADADAQPDGDIRVADFDFLANGNIVIAGESRQNQSFVDIFGAPAPNRHAVYRVVDSQGNEVKPMALISTTLDAQIEMWHGIGVTRNGFAARYSVAGRAKIRMFDNNGIPQTDELDIAEITENPFMTGGGRGDSSAFLGNGQDAYVLVDRGNTEAGKIQAWVTVFNADGSVRWNRLVNDDIPEVVVDRVGGAMDESGRVVATFDSGHEKDSAFPWPGYSTGMATHSQNLSTSVRMIHRRRRLPKPAAPALPGGETGWFLSGNP